MKKLNNKGVTIIELILSFTILIVIVYGMFNVVVEIRSYSEDKKMNQELVEYKNRMIYLIQDDLIKKGYKSTTTVSSCSENWLKCIKINFSDGSNKTLKVNMKTKVISYGGIDYEIPYSKTIEFIDSNIISFCNTYTNKSDCEAAGNQWGNTYHDSNEDVIFSDSNSILTIDIPYFIIDESTNYGFKIVHPYGLD